MDVTDEMRAAVYTADCALLGHIMDISQAISNDPHNNPGTNTPTVRCEDPHKIPHMSCRRCSKVWLIIEQPGTDYVTALDNLNSQLLPEAQIAAPPADISTIEAVSDVQ